MPFTHHPGVKKARSMSIASAAAGSPAAVGLPAPQIPGGPITVTPELDKAFAALADAAVAYKASPLVGRERETPLRRAALDFTLAFHTANPGRYGCEDGHRQELAYQFQREEIDDEAILFIETADTAASRARMFEELCSPHPHPHENIYWTFLAVFRYDGAIFMSQVERDG